MCECGKGCKTTCRTVITKQGERGPQGPVGPPGPAGANGTDADINAANVQTELTALGWFKQKVLGVLQFRSIFGVRGIDAAIVGDDIQVGITTTPIVDHTVDDADVTSTKFTSLVVDSANYSYKDLHNKMVYFTGSVSITGDFSGVTGTFAIDLTLANLPVNISVNDLDTVYLQITGVTQELHNVRAQVTGDQIIFSRSDFAFTNGVTYSIFISFSGVKPTV